jgi:aquaporin Z
LAFGFAIIASAYAIGNISGCHVNPAVSLAMLLEKKISLKDFVGYVIAQILGALAGSGILYAILSSTVIGTDSLGANGYGILSATDISLLGAIVTEIILTFIFIYTILGVTSDDKKSNVAGIVIGLTLTFVHLLGIALTGTSVNPARSLAPALIMGGEELSQVWVFIVAPLVGAILATYTFKFLNKTK